MERISWNTQGGSRLFYINRCDTLGEFSYPAHDHEDHWEFVYVVSGFFVHEMNGQRVRHEEGRITLIRDADVHALDGKAFSYVNLAFPPAWLDRFGLFSLKPNLRTVLTEAVVVPQALVPQAERGLLVARFDALLRIAETPEAVGAFSSLFSLLVSYIEAPGPVTREPAAVQVSGSPSHTAPRWLAELLAWAEKRDRPPSMAEFILKSGYSAEHLIRTLGANHRLTPSRFLGDLRLRRAEDLLRFTNYPIARVADESGWESVRHFERRFRERAGCSPREYRSANAILAH
jgi:AraC-like DNA-binding protein